MSNSTPEKILTKMRVAQNEFYNAGLNGEVFTLFPNLAIDTTAEEKAIMIDNAINAFCAERGSIIQSQELRETMQLIYEAIISSYLEGLSARKVSSALV